MGYQALLFCSDEKTARTVTQVLSELEFSVAPCTEAFAAVKKLMGGHFDAIVVDCDDEQNATLIFKSARNSTSNQASLAVAVVEGQAGVAKAFRIGANLVLTKPINVEQAKGTLRVARGLLRKGEATKSATPASATPAAPKNVVAGAIPAAPTRSASLAASTSTSWPSSPVATSRPSFAQAASPMANSVPSVDEADPIDLDAIATGVDEVQPATSSASLTQLGSDAASAPARARTAQDAGVQEAPPLQAPSDPAAIFETTVDLAKTDSSASAAAVPTFTFGGANIEPAPAGGLSKKVLIGVAAALLVAVGIYVGWTQFQPKANTPSENPTPSTSQSAPHSNMQSAAPSKPTHSSISTTPPSAHSEPTPSVSAAGQDDNEQTLNRPVLRKPGPEQPAHSATSGSSDAEIEKLESVAPTAAQPIVVKNSANGPTQRKVATPDAPAPSMLGIAGEGSGGALSNLIPNGESSTKPVLQALNVSQGVSQGLLIKKVQPNYPPSALRMHLEGSVQLLATIAKNGNITSVNVLSGEPLLAKAALDAVKQWKYKPYYLNGEPVEIQTQVTVNFKLPR
jgi:TonB family protein